MLFFLPAPPSVPPALASPQEQVQQQREAQQVGSLQIEYERVASIDVEAGTMTFEGAVKATYGETVVTADRLSLDYRNNKGVAEGGVELRDPEAFMSTERLEFDWEAKTGFAENVYVQVGNMRIRAQSLTIDPDLWRLERARATLSRKSDPQYEILARTVRIYPGKYGIANKVSLDLFGLRLGSAPEMRFDLDPRIDGFNLPSIAERRGVGLGVSWASSFLLNDQTVLGATAGSFPNRYPNYGLNVIFMNAEAETSFRKLKPMDDLKEQGGDGWFENVGVREPRNESAAIRSPRILYMIGSKWNTSTVARPEILNNVSKAYEAVFESAGTVGGVGLRGNFRVQSIRESAATPFVDRFVSNVTVQSPVWYLNNKLGLQVRGDLFSTFSENTEYGWLRGQVGLLWSLGKGVNFGLAYSEASEFGTPDFLFDTRLYDRALHGRLDYVRGPYTFRVLYKYDPGTQTIFDHEYEFAFVAESFEPFVVFRQSPNDYRLGVRFRIDNFVERLQRRRPDRTVKRPF